MVTPILFFLAAGYVFWYNENHTDAVLMFPFIDTIYPASQGDPAKMGEASLGLLLILGIATMLWNILAERRYRRHLRKNMSN